MSYVESTLLPGETVSYRARLHGIIYTPGAVLVLLGIGILLLVAAYVQQRTTELVVTNRRVVVKRGWLARTVHEMRLSMVENVSVEQTLLGRVFDYGTFTVRGAGGTSETIYDVRAPLAVRGSVLAQIEVGNGASL